MKRYFFAVIFAVLAVIFVGVAPSAYAGEAEKPCLLDAKITREITELVNGELLLVEEFYLEKSTTGRGFSEEEKEKIWKVQYELQRALLAQYYSIVKMPVECATYFWARELENVLHEEIPRSCVRIGLIEDGAEKVVAELEKEGGFSWSEAERGEFKGRTVQRYVVKFLERGIFPADRECPAQE